MPSQNKPTSDVSPFMAQTFGSALRYLRKRVRLTQDELGRLVGYSREQIARLENGSRLPDLAVVAALFIPALDLKHQAELSQRLLELAGQTRTGAEKSQTITVTRTVKTRTQRVLEVVSESEARFNLPTPVFPILGRSSDLDALIELILHEARLVTLLGAPGIGKTRLALEAARRLAPHFSDGVCFVGLDSTQRTDDVPGAVAAALDLPLSADQPPASAIRSFLASREILLVLDNCEHILDAVETFAEWLSTAPKLKLLCTSRTALDLYGEYEWDVPPLALPDLSRLPALDDLVQMASLKLFASRARTADPSFSLTADNAFAIAALCVALDGLPLAVEIAAARTREIPVQELLRQIVSARQHMQLSSTLLQQTKRNIAERHLTLNNAIMWSFQLLPASQQKVFIRLGVMAGGCTLEAAQTVCGATLETLSDLASASLLRIENERVTMLETLRAFAHEQLINEDLLDEIRQAHALCFADYAREVFNGIRGAEQELWLAKTRKDHDNFRLALRYALENENSELAVAISGGLWWFWNRQGFIREGKEWLQKSLTLSIREPLTDAQKHSRAIALNGAGSICAELGDFSEAMLYHEAGLQLRKELEDRVGISIVLHNMGLVERSRGEYAAALKLLEDALALTDGESKGSLAMSYTNLGMTAAMMYNLPLASGWLERALALLTESEFPWETAYTLNIYATVCFEMEDIHRAENMAQDSLRIFQKLGDAIYLPEPQLMLAKVAHARSDFQTAHSLCAQALAQYQQMSDQYGIANVLHVLAWLALPEDPSHARNLFEDSQALRQSVNHFISPLEQAENIRLHKAIDDGWSK